MNNLNILLLISNVDMLICPLLYVLLSTLVYFILNLCAKFSLKSQPSIYGKYGKWIL